MQIQQTPDYAYGEEIAVLVERQRDRFSLTRTYEIFAERLLRSEGPWARTAPPPATTSEGAKSEYVLAAAAAFYAGLKPEEEQQALRVLARLVRVAPESTASSTTSKAERDALDSAPRDAFESELDEVREKLVARGIVVEAAQPEPPGAPTTLEIADEALVRDWPPLRRWLDENREFLYWRQKLRTYFEDWERGGRKKQDLLSGSAFGEATKHYTERHDELNLYEREYISTSVLSSARFKRFWVVGAVILLLVLALLVSLLWRFFVNAGLDGQAS